MLRITPTALMLFAISPPAATTPEFFENSVRPVFAEHCFECHGPEKQKSGLRLDHITTISKGGETGPVIVPKDPDASRLIRAIRYTDPDLQMPPSGKLSSEAIAALEQWIADGAYWPDEPLPELQIQKPVFDLEGRRETHWAWQPVRDTTPPALSTSNWPRNDIDRYVLAKLIESNFTPAPSADPATLLRRLHFVITGLPPDPETVRAFIRDPSDAAYEAEVDRLLASPSFGEAWARHWLDLTRFAETYGYEQDFPVSEAWRYRDYVIRAFNADLPYDRFVREQIAGDLIEPRIDPESGLNECMIATGFWNMMQAQHAPVDVRQDHADRIDNQIDVLGKTFLGMTVACARCHDHKFDAISAADYYALSGVFRSVRRQIAPLDAGGAIARGIAELSDKKAKAESLLLDWLDAISMGAAEPPPPDSAATSECPPPSAIPFATFDSDFEGWFPSGQAFRDGPTETAEWRLADEAYPILIPAGQAHSGRLSNRLRGVLRSPSFVLDHTRVQILAAGHGAQIRLVVEDYFLREFHDLLFESTVLTVDHGDEARWLEIAGGLEKYRGCRVHLELADEGDGYIAVDEIRLSNDPLVEAAADETPCATASLSAWCDGSATHAEVALLNEMLSMNMDGEPDTLHNALDEMATGAAGIPNPTPVLALAEANGVDERVYLRGSYKTLGDTAPRRFLTALDPAGVPFGGPGSGRLDLAEKIVAPTNPLTARVIVNRTWKHVFGRGIVASADNFGALGAAPTHPELLDYLARHYQQNGWSTKALIRKLVLSATFRMGSVAARPEDDIRDPDNVLLHRMPLRRLDAEAIRDSLLASAGTLEPTLYGKSIPAYISPFIGDFRAPKESGPLDGARRRSIYLEIRRNYLPALFMAFDFPPPDSTHGARNVSNVPAQALVLMNDPFVAEQAAALGEELAAQSRPVNERISELFRRAFGRDCNADDLTRAQAFLNQQSAAYGVAPECELASPRIWTDLCHAMFMAKEFFYVG